MKSPSSHLEEMRVTNKLQNYLERIFLIPFVISSFQQVTTVIVQSVNFKSVFFFVPNVICFFFPRLFSGVTIPLGSLTCKYNNEGMTVLAQSDYNEYIVSSREQVSVRYIVCYHYEHSERLHKANKVPTHS